MYPLIVSLLMMLLAGPAVSQEPAALTAPSGLGDGRYGFHFETVDGVVGDCDGFSVKMGQGHTISYHHGSWPDCDMDPGPAWVTFTVKDGEVRRLEVAVGDCADQLPGGTRDLGRIPGQVAADWLLDLARGVRSEVGEEAVMAACLARDAESSGRLVDIVQDRRADDDVREQALHMLAALAGARVIEPIQDIIEDRDEDMELRESAVFALSQLEDEEALDHLLEIGRGHREPQLQRAAIFALSQYEDERVVALYEEILEAD